MRENTFPSKFCLSFFLCCLQFSFFAHCSLTSITGFLTPSLLFLSFPFFPPLSFSSKACLSPCSFQPLSPCICGWLSPGEALNPQRVFLVWVCLGCLRGAGCRVSELLAETWDQGEKRRRLGLGQVIFQKEPLCSCNKRGTVPFCLGLLGGVSRTQSCHQWHSGGGGYRGGARQVFLLEP